MTGECRGRGNRGMGIHPRGGSIIHPMIHRGIRGPGDSHRGLIGHSCGNAHQGNGSCSKCSFLGVGVNDAVGILGFESKKVGCIGKPSGNGLRVDRPARCFSRSTQVINPGISTQVNGALRRQGCGPSNCDTGGTGCGGNAGGLGKGIGGVRIFLGHFLETGLIEGCDPVEIFCRGNQVYQGFQMIHGFCGCRRTCFGVSTGDSPIFHHMPGGHIGVPGNTHGVHTINMGGSGTYGDRHGP